MKKILTSFALVAASLAFAQVGINAGDSDTNEIAPDAVFHVKNKGTEKKGVVLPSVSLTSATDKVTTSNGTNQVTTGLMVWNDGNSGLTPAGYYYWDGAKWVLTGNVGASSQTWEQIRYGQNGKFVANSNEMTATTDTWLIYVEKDVKFVRLPQLTTADAGKMITVHKDGVGNTQVKDWNGLASSQAGSFIKGVGSVNANRGRTFIWDGEFWMTTNY